MPKLEKTAFSKEATDNGEVLFRACCTVKNCPSKGPAAHTRAEAVERAKEIGWYRHSNSGDNTCPRCLEELKGKSG